ncbi:MAG: hypothetical protein JXR22_11160 [Prolixibacteraceae bacterium]|nr:hypothetical protein [Prolixibacteraceae bacterium]
MNAKKTLFLLIILSLQISSFSQGLVEENKVWNLGIKGTEGDTYGNHHTILKDEISIDDVKYLKVYESVTYPYNWSEIGYRIREDSGFVYFRIYDDPEMILYNFNLKTGDSILVHGSYYFVVDSLVTKNIQGKMLKHWYMSYEHTIQELWIENYGSTTGILNPWSGFTVGADFYLLCVSKNEEILYMNPKFNTCHIDNSTSVQLQEMNKHPLQISTNPEGLLSVTMKESIKGQLYLYTTNGQLLGKELIDQPYHEFCTPGQGTALYRFISENGVVQSGKIPLQP